MSQVFWRIATDTPDYEAHDLSGRGAEATGGRWNEKGVPAVYASTTRALACLETIVHLNAGGLPLNRYLVAVTVPDDVWAGASRAPVEQPVVGWDAEPAGCVSIALGTGWLRAGPSALLVVPSVIVPEEWNVLLNPRHSDSGRVTAEKVRKWACDPRLRRATAAF